jgi:tetratricopeptide (TPR) repeat protein
MKPLLRKKMILFFTGMFFLTGTWGQQPEKTDSLLAAINSGIQDTLKVDALNKLFLFYEFSDTLKAKNFLQQAGSVSQKINYKNGLANTFVHFGFYYEDQGKFHLALEYYQKVKTIYEELKSNQGLAACYNNMGLLYMNMGNYPMALRIFQKTLFFYEKTDNKKALHQPI